MERSFKGIEIVFDILELDPENDKELRERLWSQFESRYCFTNKEINGLALEVLLHFIKEIIRFRADEIKIDGLANEMVAA
jgi:hypothetical protein